MEVGRKTKKTCMYIETQNYVCVRMLFGKPEFIFDISKVNQIVKNVVAIHAREGATETVNYLHDCTNVCIQDAQGLCLNP